jgi:hypothetical protein
MEKAFQSPKIFFMLNNSVYWIKLPSLKIKHIETPKGYLLQDFIPIGKNQVIINGAKSHDEGHKEHSFIVLSKKSFEEINCHDFGIVGFKMVVNLSNLYLISDKKCQAFCLDTQMYKSIPDMIGVHINPGCCAYNNGILVVGGINNRNVEFFDCEAVEWSVIAELDKDLFSISCIQISEQEVLIISYKEYFILNTWLKKIVIFDVLPIKTKTSKIGCPVRVKNCIYVILGSTRLLRFNIISKQWTVVNRNSVCCCQIV